MTLAINEAAQYPAFAKKEPHCPKCRSEFDHRVPRGKLMKIFLFWLPVKRYLCYKCKRKFYVWKAEKQVG